LRLLLQCFSKARRATASEIRQALFIERLTDHDQARVIFSRYSGYLCGIQQARDMLYDAKRAGDCSSWVAYRKSNALFAMVNG
jgi:hypothetical protein